MPNSVEDELLTAVQPAPNDPTFLLDAGPAELRRNDLATAYMCSDHDAAVETSHFAKGRLHLWVVPVALLLPDRDSEDHHRQALLPVDHPPLGLLHDQARQERDKPWRKRRLTGCPRPTLFGEIG